MYRPPNAKAYTYEGEKKALILSCILVVVLLLIFSDFSPLFTIGILFIGIAYVKIRQGQLLGNSALVSANNYANIDKLVDLACKRLGEQKPKVHVYQEPYLNAFSIGFSHPFSIVLHSATIQAMDEEELSFIIGHELGHIKSRHTVWLSLIAPLGTTIPGFDILFGFWQRKTEYTSDRAGLIVCQNLNAAVRSMIKISSGSTALEHTNVTEFLKQAIQVDSSQIDKSGELLGTHPYITNRIKELIAFSQNKIYHDLAGEILLQSSDITGKVCPTCKSVASLNEKSNFCIECGNPLIYQESTRNISASKCKVCGSSINESMLFCIHCGTKIETFTDDKIISENYNQSITESKPDGVGIFCSKCGSENSSTAAFCSACGTKLISQSNVALETIHTQLKKRNVILMLFFMIITLGLYYPIWFLRRRDAINKLHSKEKLGSGIFIFSILATCIYLFFYFMRGFYYYDIVISKEYETYSSITSIIVWIVLLVQGFKVKRIFDEHFNLHLNRGISFSNLATFFFNILYLQYKINRF